MATTEPAAREPTVAELFGALASGTSTLVRQEVTLVALEMSQKISYAGKQSARIAIGASLAVMSLVMFAGALVFALSGVLPLWASALTVATLFAAIAYTLIRGGMAALAKLDFTPTETIASLKDDKAWAKSLIQ